MSEKKQVAFWLEREDADLLRELAWLNRLTMTEFIRRCIRQEGEKQGVDRSKAVG
jgi:hypothetical protein